MRTANTAAHVLELARQGGLRLADRVAERARVTALGVLDGAPTQVEGLVFNRQGKLVGQTHD